jgi:hypothetical protein
VRTGANGRSPGPRFRGIVPKAPALMFGQPARGETDRMSDRDTHPQDRSADRRDAEQRRTGRGGDDRRGEVIPAEKPVPQSPEPEHDAVREGEEKLGRVKPY